MKLFSVRIPEKDLALIRTVSRARGEGLGTFVRRAVRKELCQLGYLQDEDRKALGIEGLDE